ncbi:MAG: hypothetical protein UX83_C0008G0073 [Candidatus Wolfebacteria bacterium GW2011_GWE2_47_12]|uniref:Uncharacterized protein n=1 Tax=Candidatus Wolfebacteria bacterium GW2011_GWB1_47_1 TaxID=1619007 RepID=A0A0G4ARS9_9BACT|nr:MAG: hypothetical protein UX70_C0001G0285 [Candidatus Wolfebacteria bacterium GW2011_GWB1_47_1]KKU59123.1 MAG: hypothetical protein UX83_C0008G0073 [Candidatus Wolfebacteria bacterium GW2011_GWE2_47_12]KKU65698.1 MAG: hypothetical protein UX90_C0002G0074 [Candidatus Wolfebacteria bacterium GW2011_GWD2_47_17]
MSLHKRINSKITTSNVVIFWISLSVIVNTDPQTPFRNQASLT